MPPQQPQLLRIAIYTRISKDDKSYAIGVTEQARLCRGLIAERFPEAVITGPACLCRRCVAIGTPADVYCDNDLSASGEKERPHYLRLVADINAGLIDAVVTVDTDRLHRSVRELVQDAGYMEACKDHDIPTYTVKSGHLDLSTPSGRAFATVGATFARYEWEQMVERQKSAKRRNREAGLRTSGIAGFGYRLDLDKRGDRNRQIPGTSTGLVKEPREAAAIADGYRRVRAGCSLSELARRWNEAGFTTPPPYSKPFTVSAVRRILLRPANAALIGRPWPDSDQIIGKGVWEPIVDEDLWHAVTAIIRDNAGAARPDPSHGTC